MTTAPDSPAPAFARPDIPGRGEPDTGGRYPMLFEVECPERLNRWKTAFRLILILPVLVFAWAVSGIGSAVLFAGWVAVSIRRSYPAWLFSAGTSWAAYSARLNAYGALLTDKYPSFDRDAYPVRLEYPEPPHGRLSRWRVFLWKLILLIPHFFVLFFLTIAALFVVLVAWFAILFTGRYPRGMFNFVTGVQRWSFRLFGYFASYNDRYPPYSLSPDAGPASSPATVVSGVAGGLLGVAIVAALTTFAVLLYQPRDVDVDYQALLSGKPAKALGFPAIGDPHRVVFLEQAIDPAPGVLGATRKPGQRFVTFRLAVHTRKGHDPAAIALHDFRLKVSGGDSRTFAPISMVLSEGPPPATADSLDDFRAGIVVAFSIPASAEVVSLTFTPEFSRQAIRYDFH